MHSAPSPGDARNVRFIIASVLAFVGIYAALPLVGAGEAPDPPPTVGAADYHDYSSRGVQPAGLSPLTQGTMGRDPKFLRPILIDQRCLEQAGWEPARIEERLRWRYQLAGSLEEGLREARRLGEGDLPDPLFRRPDYCDHVLAAPAASWPALPLPFLDPRSAP